MANRFQDKRFYHILFDEKRLAIERAALLKGKPDISPKELSSFDEEHSLKILRARMIHEHSADVDQNWPSFQEHENAPLLQSFADSIKIVSDGCLLLPIDEMPDELIESIRADLRVLNPQFVGILQRKIGNSRRQHGVDIVPRAIPRHIHYSRTVMRDGVEFLALPRGVTTSW